MATTSSGKMSNPNKQYQKIMNETELYDILSQIYPARERFCVVISDNTYKKDLMGFYRAGTITICRKNISHCGNGYFLLVAIHEYAHHIHLTECKRGKPHGAEFQTINQALRDRALQMGFLSHSSIFDNNGNA